MHMAPILISTTTPPATTQLETPAIIIICICAYLAFFCIILIIRQCIVDYHPDQYTDCRKNIKFWCCECCNEENFWLGVNAWFQPLDQFCCCLKNCCKRAFPKSRGFCAECNVCGKAEETNNCCDCCLGIAQACDCSVPGTTTCCDRCCGPRRHCDLADCLACGPDLNCCDERGFDCPRSSCGCCDCPAINCKKPQCNEIHCLCCTISCNDNAATSQPQPYPYQYPPPDPNSPYPNYPPHPGYPPYHIPTRGSVQYPYPPSPGTRPSQQYPYSGHVRTGSTHYPYAYGRTPPSTSQPMRTFQTDHPPPSPSSPRHMTSRAY